jgi:hypothetical protein
MKTVLFERFIIQGDKREALTLEIENHRCHLTMQNMDSSEMHLTHLTRSQLILVARNILSGLEGVFE